MNFGSFLALAKDKHTIYNLLDCKLFDTIPRPRFIGQAADDERALMLMSSDGLPPDAYQYRSWALLAHAGSYTLIHHDSGGLSTYVHEYTGVKYWFYVRYRNPFPSASEIAIQYQRVGDLNVMSMEYPRQPPWVKYDHRTQEFIFDSNIYNSEESAIWKMENPKIADIFVIRLAPGMCMAQPSDATHAVYNATECIAVGGHFLSYESLPRLEIARRGDHLSEQAMTNDYHDSIHIILQGMAYLLKTRPAEDALEMHVLEALARMMISRKSYENRLALEDESPELENRRMTTFVALCLQEKLGREHPLSRLLTG
ncbi:hypothetical protein FRB90_001116 [Tulasnella sp. 427]|nr:hypothetical protein FRB90_001116 [Tulasnella sp. 427]